MSKSRELADLINNLKNFQKKTDEEFFQEVKEKQKEFSESKEFMRYKMNMLENRSEFQEMMDKLKVEQDKIKEQLDRLNQRREETIEKGRNAIENSAPSLQAIQSILHQFMSYNANISVAVVSTFMTIALNEGRRMTDYVEMTGLPKSTISRHLLELGPATVSYTKGMGLIEITSPNTGFDTNDYFPDVDGEEDPDRYGEYPSRYNDMFHTKAEQDNREKQRAKGRVFILSRKGLGLLDVIQKRNKTAVNNFMRSVS